MSNPAVLKLVDIDISGNRLKIEDNIGESIHIHFADFRIDLTIRKFNDVKEVFIYVLNDLVGIDGFDCRNYDFKFLLEIASKLSNLAEVSTREIYLRDLRIQRQGLFGLPIIDSLNKSRVYKAINGYTAENEAYIQKNHIGKSNTDRVEDVLDLIKIGGYPFNKEYIVLFNEQFVIRDGQHRASALYSLGKDAMVAVKVLRFHNEIYDIPKYPWLKHVSAYIKSKIRQLGFMFFKVVKKFM